MQLKSVAVEYRHFRVNNKFRVQTQSLERSNFILNILKDFPLTTSGGCPGLGEVVQMSGCCLFSSLLRCSHAWSMVLASVLQHLQLLYLGSSAHGWDQHHLLSPRLWLGDHLLCTLLFSPSMEHTPTVCLGTYMCGGSPKPGLGHRRWRLVDWAFSHPKYFIFLITTTPYKNKK